ncbi:MAG: serine/threonine protein kinase [Candidatus Thiodiazotropha sp. (ex Ustalcina ferruginea)]|nr:serine/threonine protein kinase [Candidatus Thiodiazotropha sp. (ex Ustalcina ferruginea)]
MPESIGRFSLIEEIGEGAMSIVYKAFDPEINRTLAIKLLRGECAADPEYRYRFLQEAKAAGKLTHPNIVTIFDVGEVAQGPYIAMEFLEGRTLEQMMDSDAKISTRETVVYGIQLAEALDYSHARGIVHRDVKPGNIISPDDGHTIRITDFGIAHVDSPNKEHRTMMGAVLGTPQYMSPEQVEGLPVDGRSDLFSMGVILYQLITGEKPFVSETLTSLCTPSMGMN